MLKTVEMLCTNCSRTFAVASSQYTYQEKKRPGRDWFCSRSCTTTFSNLHKRSESYYVNNKTRLRQQQKAAAAKGTKARTKYDQRFVWYMGRMAYDARFQHHTLETKHHMIKVLEQLWEKQEGKCALSGLPLQLKEGRTGTTAESNPFLIASVDRIDCNLPYQPGNIQWVSCALNLARNNTPLDEFKEHLTVLKTV